MNTPSTLYPISPKPPTEHSTYCVIVPHLVRYALKESPISSHLKDVEEEEKEELNKGEDQHNKGKKETPLISPNILCKNDINSPATQEFYL